jgi:transcriptional regulator with XRE-family HTH domain
MDLRCYLDAHAISTAHFAADVGVSVQTIHRYLNGDRMPRREVMERIACVTGGKVQPNDFFTLEDAA